MKKIFGLLAAIIVVTMVASLVLMPARGFSDNNNQEKAVSVMPDSIMKIFQKSCMNCHADDGNSMAKSRVNFSKWETYKPEKQADKAKDICKVLTKGAMPPKGYRSSHPEDIPVQAEVDAICKWAESFKK